MLNNTQKNILNKATPTFAEELYINIANSIHLFEEADQQTQLNFLLASNAMYRHGEAYIDDHTYDVAQSFFASIYPDHDFVNRVEPELMAEGKTVPLPVRMLSTDKAYSKDEIIKWVNRIKYAAQELQLPESDIIIRITPKLDGFAGYDDGTTFYTRGDGVKGTDISRAFARGLKVGGSGHRGLGQGEIVISKSYFAEFLSDAFEDTRSMQASIIAEKAVDSRVQQAIDDGAAVFFPFSELQRWEGNCTDFIDGFDEIVNTIWTSSDYDVDGVVIETTNNEIKELMGFTRHHYRWQIAFKANTETANVLVQSVTPQTARTGRIMPVAELEPTKLSRATIKRVTAHHYGFVKENGIGKGAVIELVRSGLVIPKIQKIISSATAEIPVNCPSCGADVVWDGDNLFCPNTTGCPAQAENTLIHFFNTLGNIDGFGPATISILYANGIRTIPDVYDLISHPETLAQCGFKEKTINNLIGQLKLSIAIEIEDWRFMAAFGVERLGRSSSENIFMHYPIEQIFDLTAEQIGAIEGFAEKSSSAIIAGLASIKETFSRVFALKFNLKRTKLQSEAKDTSPISGLTIVFTGSMQHGNRGDMEKEAKALGCKVGSSVSAKTSYLVTGENVGEKKITDAKNKGVKVISEQEYLDLLAGK